MEKPKEGSYLRMWNYLAASRGFLGKNRPVLADRQIQQAQEILNLLMDPENNLDLMRKP
jgi:hypothetical protein